MFNKIKKINYIKSEIVFIVDLLLSVGSSVIAGGILIFLLNIVVPLIPSLYFVLMSSLVSAALIFCLKLHKRIIRYFTAVDALRIVLFSGMKQIVAFSILYFVLNTISVLIYVLILDFMVTIFTMICLRIVLIAGYRFMLDYVKNNIVDAYLFGSSDPNPNIAKQINLDADSKYKIKGFLTTSKCRKGTNIAGLEILEVRKSEEELLKLFSKKRINTIIFTSKKRFLEEKDGFVAFCMFHKINLFMLGDMQEIDGSSDSNQRQVKPIRIEDLLDRPEIQVDIPVISAEIKGKVVMVTGAAGSIGSELARQVATFGVKTLVLFDAAETPLHNINLEFNKKSPALDVVYVLGDVRSKDRVSGVMNKYLPQIVFHAAAYKHVPMIEANPCEGILTNVWGSINVAKCAIDCNVSKFVMISTDKAVNPTNVMGATKRLAEMCVQRLNGKQKGTEFITTRFGNVLGSNGSVIPLFKEQIAKGGPVTVTHPDIVRYFMTIPEACRLVLQAATMGHAGEILVFDMGKEEKIVDLARKMIQLSGFEPDKDIKIEFTGLRPGEKLYEELLKQEENRKSNHEKIQIAHSIVVNNDDFEDQIQKLIAYAKNVKIYETVKQMKVIVPEFKSKNSEFEKMDNDLSKNI